MLYSLCWLPAPPGAGDGEGGAAVHTASHIVALLTGLCLLFLGVCKVCVRQGGGTCGCPSLHGLEQGEEVLLRQTSLD